MSNPRNQIEEIEATQEALRASIEQSKQLAVKADNLLQQHKKSLQTNDLDSNSRTSSS